MHWTGYMVHISETCDHDNVHLITHVQTTAADVHEAMSTEAIHQSLAKKACFRLSISLMRLMFQRNCLLAAKPITVRY